MPESTPVNPAETGLEIPTSYVRSRNVLLAKADLGPLFVDFYIHLADHGIRNTPAQDSLFRHALACMVLHCASRPWNEIIAWTLHFEALKWNVFLNGENTTGTVTGRLFDQDVKEMDGNYFYADVIRGNQPKRRSVACFTGDDPLVAVETFYRQSEQRGVKAFHLGNDKYALVAEHPDFDETWFSGLTVGQVNELETHETVVPLEKRLYRWHCGCNQSRMLQVLAPVFKDDPEGVFGNEARIEMRCPRCGARHRITREAMEAYMADEGRK